jgi:hypothetical protein
VPLFYFDHMDGDRFYPDTEGGNFPSTEAARLEATRALADAAKDSLPGAVRREIAIEVSDENRKPLFRTALWFEVQPLSQNPTAGLRNLSQERRI